MADEIVESDTYVRAMESQMNFKVEDTIKCLEGIDDGVIVDLGCFNNQLNIGLKERLGTISPDLEYVGVDCNINLLKRRKDGQVIAANALQLPFKDESISAFVLSSAMHEIVKGGEVRDFLKSLQKMLKPKGRIIIRDLVKPENPEEPFDLKFNREEKEIFDRFVDGYAPIKNDNHFVYDVHSSKARMPAYLVYEYLRHRMFWEDGLDHFNHELEETYGKESLSELKVVATDLGFSILSSELINSPLTLPRVEKYKSRIEIRDADGIDLDVKTRMPTHALLSLEKSS